MRNRESGLSIFIPNLNTYNVQWTGASHNGACMSCSCCAIESLNQRGHSCQCRVGGAARAATLSCLLWLRRADSSGHNTRTRHTVLHAVLPVSQLRQDETDYEAVAGRRTQDARAGRVLHAVAAWLQLDNQTRLLAVALDEVFLLCAAQWLESWM